MLCAYWNLTNESIFHRSTRYSSLRILLLIKTISFHMMDRHFSTKASATELVRQRNTSLLSLHRLIWQPILPIGNFTAAVECSSIETVCVFVETHLFLNEAVSSSTTLPEDSTAKYQTARLHLPTADPLLSVTQQPSHKNRNGDGGRIVGKTPLVILPNI